jgi:predicted NUDIX family phosphoesterase
MDRNILCLPNQGSAYFGFMRVGADWSQIGQYLNENAVPVDRSAAETDPTHKQVIPYVTIIGSGLDGNQQNEHVLCAIRLPKGAEDRLHGKIATGFGGHVKHDPDLTPQKMVERSIVEELREELGYDATWEELSDRLTFRGIINSDVSDVDRVHVGLSFTLDVPLQDHFWDNIRSAEPEKLSVFWTPVLFLSLLEERMENWAKLAVLGLMTVRQEGV